MEFLRSWIDKSPYSAALGVVLEDVADGAAQLRLPFNDDNTNPGQVLHGGVAASLASIGAQSVTRLTMRLGRDGAAASRSAEPEETSEICGCKCSEQSRGGTPGPSSTGCAVSSRCC